MRAKVLLIAGVTVVGTGIALHTTGHEPKCLMQTLHATKPVAAAKTTATFDPSQTDHVPVGLVKKDHEDK